VVGPGQRGRGPRKHGHHRTAQVGSLNPIEGVGGVKPLTDADKERDQKEIRKVLTSPEISFESSSVKVAGNSATVSGNLTSWAQRAYDVQLTESDGRSRAASRSPDALGYQAFTAMMSTLRVADRVDVDVRGRLPA